MDSYILEHLSTTAPRTELPPLDIFVTTADPYLEPPILTVNTVLSLLAVDYPAHRLACYVSDDGCSPLNFYSLVEASNFAKLWEEYERLCGNIEAAANNSTSFDLTGELEVFSTQNARIIQQ
ncbi:hypothetical protein WN944_023466 [Citrus x changshan-huyou]|uniref:Cellulose synthase n=1 Tax=Citrus x changshan-huyou TaxID=2935761 RepID=A0AAP0N4R9_9ROSI